MERLKKYGSRMAPIAVGLLTVVGSGAVASSKGQPRGAASAAADRLLKEPYVDIDEWRDTPVRHRYVHGGFKATDARFSIYFPPKEQYKGRFFQHVTPTTINEKEGATGAGTGDEVGFAFASGGYFLVTNEGGFADRPRPYRTYSRLVSSLSAYCRASSRRL